MLIFGTYVIHRTLGEGHMMCPQCMGVTSYRVRRGRWFFHILFIPLIPMKRTPPHVECLTCRSKFALGVLGADAEQYRDGATPPPLAQVMQQVPQVPAPHPGGQQGASHGQPDPQRSVEETLHHFSVALVRGTATEVLRRSEAVTDAGVGAVIEMAASRGVTGVTPEQVRSDVAGFDASYLGDVVRRGVARGVITPSGARGLVAEATSLARRNGALTAAQWDWIVTLGLDAGVGPTASAEIRDEVLARG